MLVHAAADVAASPQSMEPDYAAGGYPLWEGKPTGMAASTLALTPLTVQQNVPNIGEAQVAPKTKVRAPDEQGEGRAPGWRWGWMRKNIPFAPATQEHKQRPFGPLRIEPGFVSTAHPPGTGREQSFIFKEHKKRPIVLAGPSTVYYTAAAPPTPTWGEPL